jgi:adenylate cyclase
MNQLYVDAKQILNDPQKVTKPDNQEARDKLNDAISADSSSPLLYGLLSYTYVRDYQNAWSENRDLSLDQAEFWARKELEMVDALSAFDGHWSLAIVYSNQGRFKESFQQYDLALGFKPDDPDLLAEMGEALMYAGRFDEAIAQINKAIEPNGGNPRYWYRWNLARVFYMQKRYTDAVNTIADIENPPVDVFLITAASKAQLGQLDAANADMAIFTNADPNWSVAKSEYYRYVNDSDRQHWLDGLRLAGLK